MENNVVQEKLASMSSDLRFLMRDAGVSELAQAHLAAAARDIPTFRNVVDQKSEIRTFMKEFYNLGGTDDGLEGINIVAAIMAAWEAAGTYKETKDKTEAEDRMLGLPKQVKKSTFLQTKKTFVQVHGSIDPAYVPARGVVEILSFQLEEEEFVALNLDEVPTAEEAPDEETLTPLLGRDMTVKYRRTSKLKNKAPWDQESLRKRIRVLGHAYMFVAIRHPNQKVFAGMCKDTWTDYADWVMSSKVAGMCARNEKGEKVRTPSWPIIMNYEFQVRKKAAELICTESVSMVDALNEAMKDAEVRNEHFHNVFSVSIADSKRKSRSRSRSRSFKASKVKKANKQKVKKEPNTRSPSSDRDKKYKAKAKSQGGWKGKGDGKGSGKAKLHMNTEDRRPICFKFNNKDEGCKDSRCKRVHVCQLCQGKEKTSDDPHPLFRCPLYKDYKKSGGTR